MNNHSTAFLRHGLRALAGSELTLISAVNFEVYNIGDGKFFKF